MKDFKEFQTTQLNKKLESEEKKKARTQSELDKKRELLCSCDPYIKKLQNGEIPLNVSKLTGKLTDGGMRADLLRDIVKALGGKPANTKLQNAERVVILINQRPATTMAQRVTQLLQPLSESPKLTTREEIMSVCCKYFLKKGHESYGGFIRDWVISGTLPEDADLDVELGDDAAAGVELIASFKEWARKVGLEVTNGPFKGANVLQYVVKKSSVSIDLQLVNTAGFMTRQQPQRHNTRRSQATNIANGPLIDIDVNNLKMSTLGIVKRVENEGGDLNTIISHCEQKTFTLVKPAEQIADRLQKMRRRGWSLIS